MTRPGHGAPQPGPVQAGWKPPAAPRVRSATTARQLLGVAVAAAVVVAIIAVVLAVVGIPVTRSATAAGGPAGTPGGPLTIGLPTQPIQRWTVSASDIFGPSAHDIGYTSAGGGIAILGAHTDTDNMVMAVDVADGRPHWQHPAAVPDANGCWVSDFADVLCKSSSDGKRPAKLYFISGTDGSVRKTIDVPPATIKIADVDSTWIVYTSGFDSDATDVRGYGPDGAQRWHVTGDFYQVPLVSESTGLVAIQNSSQGQVMRGADGHVVYTTGGKDSTFNRITLFYNGFSVSSLPRGADVNQVALYDVAGRQIAANHDDWQTTSQDLFDPYSFSLDCQGILVHRSTLGAASETIGVLDPVTGKLLWQTSLAGDLRNDRCIGGRVFSIPFDNGYSDTVIDLRTGKRYGTVDLVNREALMGDDGERAIYRISASPGSDTTVGLTAFDLTTLQKVWTQPIDDNVDWNLDAAGLWKVGSATISRYTSN